MEHRYTNALIHEKSPYLLQHAHNPVNWRAWNDETFRYAAEHDKPVFLSIGYSTCHWCHVMEHESFEDEQVAAVLNEYFIPVKVDREERPDVDGVYMAVCQAMTGHGGWPLSVFLTPDKRPFYVGTYFPKENRHGRPGFLYVIEQIRGVWQHDRAKIEEAGDSILQSMESRAAEEFTAELGSDIFDAAFSRYAQAYDEAFGGFGNKPKFPSPHNLLFLLRYYKRTNNSSALAMVEHTLRSMRRGGLFDHIGFGFHRYSTDSRWLLPHFEKMLYDQAMLCMAYTEAWQATGNAVYKQTTEEIIAYVLRDMLSPEGGFYSAEDADSEGVEGKFYVWTLAELRAVLGDADARLFADIFGCEAQGNFAEEATGHKTGDNIPHLTADVHSYARQHDMEPMLVEAALERMRAALFAVRERRVHPSKDDKILADWNGLMIAALAKAGRATGRSDYLDAARRAFGFVTTAFVTPDGRLLHRYRDGDAAISAFLDDYVFLAWGALELYEATLEVEYLLHARRLCDDALRLFSTEDSAALSFSAADNEKLLASVREAYDGAVPSGNSVAAWLLARLGRLCNDNEFLSRSHAIVRAFGRQVKSYPIGFAQMLMALDFLAHSTQEIIVADGDGADELLAVLSEYYTPFAVLACNTGDERLYRLVEFARYQAPVGNRAAVYVCANYTCKAPVTTPAALRSVLEGL